MGVQLAIRGPGSAMCANCAGRTESVPSFEPHGMMMSVLDPLQLAATDLAVSFPLSTMRTKTPLSLLVVFTLIGSALSLQEQRKIGHDDTPFFPGSEWRVHDGNRPQPKVITPGLGGAPPSDAVVLFDGTDLDSWRNVEGKDGKWKLVEGGAMEVTDAGSMETIEHFGDCQLHVEWATPAEVKNEDQLRGNSGIFMMGKYEIQILDSWENFTYPDGQAGAMYGQRPPRVNASRAPGEWQSFDIIFEAPVFEDGKLVSPAVATILHNGVLIHHRAEFLGITTYKRLAKYAPHGARGPIMLQDHWFPNRFRNIWVREI
jgi:hypothetical protein